MATRPYYTSAAWLDTARLAQGIAYAKLEDGRSLVVRSVSGGWAYVLAGVISDTYPNADAAIAELTGALADEHILLRRR